MSDERIVVFTLRDLNRRPARVLEAVRKYGRADIRTRSGEVFSFVRQVDGGGKDEGEDSLDFEGHWKRLRELGLAPPPPSENERLNRIIAGEE